MNTARVLIAGVALAAFSLSLGGCNLLPGKSVTPRDDNHVPLTDVPERVYWGDTHLHTSNSVDAFGFGNRLPPEAALRFARGEEVTSSTGLKAQLDRPLDFLVITDHSAGLGSTQALYDAPRLLIRDPRLLRWHDLFHGSTQDSLKATSEILAAKGRGESFGAMNDPKASAKRTRSIWTASADMVERYYEPGKFTAFHGFEYTLMQGGNNLHRNVIFRDANDKVKTVLPLDDTGHVTPDALWDYMDGYEKATGGHVLSIPHNGNLSNGLMWQLVEPGGGPMSAAYARRRAAHEPIVEITQIKGDSEAHPFLSPNDEFAGYGTLGWDLNNLLNNQPTKPGDYAGSYVREALKRGLAIEQRTGVNPYKYGVIGSTDAHTSLSTADENNYFGKHPGVEPSAHRATDAFLPGLDKVRMNWQALASGYAAVWARANTRGALFDAMMRKEVYATTGPRMVVRFFGGWDFSANDLKSDWVHAGYKRGVPMGGTLPENRAAAHANAKPSFMVSALKDPKGANLDRVQVIKGWADQAGATHEKVFDVVWSDMDKRHPAGGKVPAVGDTVDVANARYTNTIGAPSLSTVWTDPEFDPKLRAFYYVRVLEIPTPMWPAFDAVKYHIKLPADVRVKGQERAYTSSIWYAPAG